MQKKIDKFHYHEITDRLHCIVSMVEQLIGNHPVVHGRDDLELMVEEVYGKLNDLYQHLADEGFHKYTE